MATQPSKSFGRSTPKQHVKVMGALGDPAWRLTDLPQAGGGPSLIPAGWDPKGLPEEAAGTWGGSALAAASYRKLKSEHVPLGLVEP